MIHEGACHCGAVLVAFESHAGAQLATRACQCSFCRRHGARTVSDADGALTIRLAAPPNFYKFASHTADVLICATCGCYIASSIEGPAGRVATLNVVGALVAGLSALAPTPIVYDAETAEAKRARRLAVWTPTRIEIDPAAKAS